jgi:hypothetical protein
MVDDAIKHTLPNIVFQLSKKSEKPSVEDILDDNQALS